MKTKKPDFIAYEYITLSVDNDMKSVYSDCYQNFGWSIEGFGSSAIGSDTITIKLKRDRRVQNKSDLNKLQKECEHALETIYHLEKTKSTKPMISALATGLIGTVFMAGATFCYLGGFIIWCAILAIPGFIGWALPYFIYQIIKKAQTNKVNPKIDEEYERVYRTCEEASEMIYV